MKALKWVGIVVGAVIVLMVAAAVIIPLVVDPNDYKDDISAAVEKATGRKLVIDGDIGLSVWPSLSLELGKVTLSNPPGFGDKPFAHIDSANISVALMPLLDKKVEADAISLHGMALDLQVKADGSNNWDDLAGAGAGAGGEEEKAKGDSGGAGVAALAIGGINVKDARLAYDDRAARQKLAIEGLDLTTGPIELREPIAIDAKFRLIGTEPQINADVSLATTVELDLLAKRYRARDLKLGVRTDSKAFAINKAELQLTGQVLADLGANVVSVSDIDLQLGSDLAEPRLASDLHLSGGIMYRTDSRVLRGEGTVLEFDARGAGLGIGDDGKAKGRLSTDVGIDLAASRYDLSNMKLAVDATGAGLPGGKVDAKVESTASIDLGQDKARLGDLIVETLGLYLTGNVDVAKLQSAPVARGSVTLAPFNPRELLGSLGVDEPLTTDPAVLKKAEASLDFEASQSHAKLPKLALKLDDTRIDGNLSVANMNQPDKQAIAFRLAIDAIDVDRYMPPVADGGAGSATATATAAADAPAAPASAGGDASASASSNGGGGGGGAPASQPVGIPLDVVRALNLDGVLDIGKLKVNNLRSEQVHLTVKAKDGVLDLDPFKASLYQGSGLVRLRVDARKAIGQYRVSQELQGVQIGPLLKDLNGEDKVHGTANISSTLTTAGNDPDAITRALNGDLRFEVANGAVKGVNIAKLIRDAKAMLKGGASTADDEPAQTDFSNLTGSATITNGVLINNDLEAKSPLLRVNGEGKVDLPAQQLDYLVRTVIVGTSKGQGGKEMEELKGLPIPVRITGSFAKPEYKVDLGKVLEEKAKEKLKQKLEDKLKDKLGGALGGVAAPGGDAAQPAQPSEPQSPKEAIKDQLKDKLLKGLFGR